MIGNYTNNPKLFDRCINLINEAFPGCKEFALKGIKYKAFWNKASTPFVVEERGEVIAHAGVWPITFILNGEEHRSASIHGVCVKASHQGKGYFKQLMQEVMQYVVNNFDSSILFTVKPYLYKNLPYKIMLPEYDFMVSEKINFHATAHSKNSDLRIMQWDDPEDVNLMHQLLSNRIPLSNQFSILHENGNALFVLNMMEKNVYYSEKHKLLIVYEVIDKTLYLKEIISLQQHQLSDVIRLILGADKMHFNKIVMQFCPDRFLGEEEYSPILARPECCIMASDTFLFKGDFFRYPELYWC